MSNNSNSPAGIGLPGLLGVLFIGLKLTGHISWSWVWVLAPFWVPVVLTGIVLGIAAFYSSSIK